MSPCYHHGACNKTTGLCTCDPKWRGNANCSECSHGFTGDDCTVLLMPSFTMIATCTGFGNIIAFNGVAYTFRGSGEYVLFTSSNLQLQVSTVSCYRSRRCINAVAMVTSTSVVTIHAPFKNGDDTTVWIDQIQTYNLKTSFVDSGVMFTLQRHSWARFEFGTQGLQFNVNIFGRYLDLTMKTNSNWCRKGSGLWGSCQQNSSKSLALRNLSNLSVIDISQDIIDNQFVASWKVLTNVTSVFVYNDRSTNEPRVRTGGRYCLKFHNTGITTKALFSLAAGDLTLEIAVKSDGSDGTMLSYATTSTLAIVIQRTVKVFYGSVEFDTFLTMQPNSWHHIALVWTKSTKIFQLILIEPSQKQHSRNFPINTNRDVFEPGGILALGYWYPSAELTIGVVPGPFTGEVDELRIWNTRRTIFEIVTTRTVNIDCDRRLLANLWKFNEGEGKMTIDCASSVPFFFPSQVQGPTWVFSTAHLMDDVTQRIDINEKLENTCNALLYGNNSVQQCNSLPLAVKQFYAMGCFRMSVVSGGILEQVWNMFAYFDYCEKYTKHNTWPGMDYCNQLKNTELPEWVKLQCNEYCVFGITIDNKCECRQGFYGKKCSSECPGGYSSPCGNQATCDLMSGTCKCPTNANGSNDCMTCSSGWTGSDCSIALVNSKVIPNRPHCHGYGGGHISTFDGSSYDVGTPGEYYLLKRANFAVQVRVVPCMNSTYCIIAVALRLDLTNLTLRAPYGKNNRPSLYINQAETDYTQQQTIKVGYVLKQEQPNQFRLSQNGRTVITLRVDDKYLSFTLESEVNICWNSSGKATSRVQNYPHRL